MSDCGQWLIITPQKDCRDNLLFFCDLTTLPNKEISGKVNLTQVVHKLEADYEVILLLYVLKIIKELIFEIKCSHNGFVEDRSFLGCFTVSLGE